MPTTTSGDTRRPAALSSRSAIRSINAGLPRLASRQHGIARSMPGYALSSTESTSSVAWRRVAHDARAGSFAGSYGRHVGSRATAAVARRGAGERRAGERRQRDDERAREADGAHFQKYGSWSTSP